MTYNGRQKAGKVAEEQISHYLNRAFGSSKTPRVINDLRLLDEKRPKLDGKPDVCQIDHLVIHRAGVFIVESKSVCEKISVRSTGSGGDQWTRTYRGVNKGIDSPIEQGIRQGVLLRRVLDDAREDLLGKMPIGLRSVTKLVSQSEHRSFGPLPVQVIVAISTKGVIETKGRWTAPEKPFRHFLCKADQVTTLIQQELDRHKKAKNPLAQRDGDYGLWSMKADEVEAVFQFLLENNSPRRPAQPKATPPAESGETSRPAPKPTATTVTTAATPSCRHCGGSQLSARSGKYGYYWKCASCDKNTPMPKVCSCCGAESSDGKRVRIRKQGSRYYRMCEQCDIEERIWDEPNAGLSG